MRELTSVELKAVAGGQALPVPILKRECLRKVVIIVKHSCGRVKLQPIEAAS